MNFQKEYYARLNDIRMMPYRGELVLLFRESSCWYEIEIFRVNTFRIEQWLAFCRENKVLYWCYLDKIDSLIVRPIRRARGEWYTPDLPLFGNKDEGKKLRKPPRKPVWYELKTCLKCSASKKDEAGNLLGCFLMNKFLPSYHSLSHRKNFLKFAKDNFHFPNCFTLTKPNRKEKK